MKGLHFNFKSVLIAAITAVLLILVGWSAVDHLREPKLPYRDSFARSGVAGAVASTRASQLSKSTARDLRRTHAQHSLGLHRPATFRHNTGSQQLRWPGHFTGGTKIDSMVELVDIAPTLLDAAGIPVPSGMQGCSLLPLLKGQTQTHRGSVYMEYYDANATYEIPPMISSVRTAKWKLNFCDKPRSGELYDLEKDPGEFHNLWNDAHYKDTREMMLQNLVARMIETTDPLPERHTTW